MSTCFLENNQKDIVQHLNYFCVDFFESHGVTPEQDLLDVCEAQIQILLQNNLENTQIAGA